MERPSSAAGARRSRLPLLIGHPSRTQTASPKVAATVTQTAATIAVTAASTSMRSRTERAGQRAACAHALPVNVRR